MKRFSAVAVAVFLSASAIPGWAQQKIEWRQVSSIPLGSNLPAGIKPAILGITVGDKYETVRPMVDELAEEHRSYDYHVKNNSVVGELIREDIIRFELPVSGGQSIMATYPGVIHLDRTLKGAGNEAIYDRVDIYFSAPSSGAQVNGISRNVIYHNVNDQPRISAILEALSATLKGAGKRESDAKEIRVLYQFDNGRPVEAGPSINAACPDFSGLQVVQQAQTASMNRKGDCDVALMVRLVKGLSDDHAFEMQFRLSDNERTKANSTADYSFFEQYVNSLRDRPKAVPKL